MEVITLLSWRGL